MWLGFVAHISRMSYIINFDNIKGVNITDPKNEFKKVHFSIPDKNPPFELKTVDWEADSYDSIEFSEGLSGVLPADYFDEQVSECMHCVYFALFR